MRYVVAINVATSASSHPKFLFTVPYTEFLLCHSRVLLIDDIDTRAIAQEGCNLLQVAHRVGKGNVIMPGGREDHQTFAGAWQGTVKPLAEF